MSHERRKLLKAYGAELVVTPGESGMRGAIEKAEEILEQQAHGFMLQQFNNGANPLARANDRRGDLGRHTGEGRRPVAGVGTGGTITGVGRYLKRRKPEVRVVAVEPRAPRCSAGAALGIMRSRASARGSFPGSWSGP